MTAVEAAQADSRSGPIFLRHGPDDVELERGRAWQYILTAQALATTVPPDGDELGRFSLEQAHGI
eukprot:4734022-Pyramimonas_sp.AAC.1